jgi:hypothetical protein
MNQHCRLCDQPRKPRHDRPGKFFTLCADHYAEYQRQKNRESYAKHREKRVKQAKQYRESHPDEIKAYSDEYYSRIENAERRRNYMKTYRRPWRLHVKDHCERCGFKAEDTKQLDVHHKDWDKTNNDPANLETLCPPCHRLIEPLDALK